MKALARLRELAGERDWLLTILSVAAVVGLGVLIGQQYLQPDKRVIAVSVAVIMLGVTWRVDMVTGLGVLLLALPFPRGTVFGTTTLAFVLLLVVVWMLRLTQRTAPAPRRTPFDGPIAGLLIAYTLSFYNVTYYDRAFAATLLFLACVLMFYLIVLNVRTEPDLRRLHLFQAGAIGLIYAFCLWELFFPGHELIPGWIDLRDLGDASIAQGNYRVGGPWRDYELLSEFGALNTIFFIFMIAQARSNSRRAIFVLLLLLSVVVEFATVTRGGTAALVVALLYLMWLSRRRLKIVPLTIVGGIAALVIGVLATALHQLTHAGDLFARFGETRLVNGMPDSRADVWPQAWQRMLQHPLIGHGPYYDSTRGIVVWFWPHDLPLFIGNCFGFLGLGVFVWLMVTFWRQARPRTDRLDDRYVESFLLVTRVQLVLFFVDQMKIEHLRNQVYQFQPWVIFATLAAAAMIRQHSTAPATAPAAAPAPRPGRLAPVPARS